jgi:hypothetical protein
MIKKVLVLIALPVVVYLLVGYAGMSLGQISGRQLFVIANTWNDFLRENTTDIDAMPAQALQAYLVLKNRGFTDNQIELMLYYPNNTAIDVDGDGTNDLIGAVIDSENYLVTKEALRASIDESLKEAGKNDEVTIYIVAHGELVGGSVAFSFESGYTVTYKEFEVWLTNSTCKRLNIFLDFCYSGSFARFLVKAGRLVIYSAEDNLEGWFYWNWRDRLNNTDRATFGNSGSAFFHPFWEKFSEGSTVYEALQYGKKQCLRWGSIDNKSRSMTQVQNPGIYTQERNFWEDFVFHYPGGVDTLVVSTILLAFVESIIITAVLVERRR